MNVRAERFPLFDSLRAIAALMIVALHASILGGALDPGARGQSYIVRLDAGVSIFFVISGFLLYRPFVATRLADADPPALLGYAWRRFLRIVPAYWVALTLLALLLNLDNVFTGRGLVAYYGFGQIYDRDLVGGGITQAWTLDVELSFYVALPLVAAAARALGGRVARSEVALIGGLTLASIAFNAVVAFGGLAGTITYAPVPLLSALPASFFFFGLGMLMAVAHAALAGRERQPRAVSAIEARSWACWGVAVAAYVLVSRLCGGADNMSAAQWMARQLLYAVAAVGIVLPAVFGDPAVGFVRRLLANRVLLYLGLISYSIYLWHLGLMLKLAAWGYGDDPLVHPYLHWMAGGLVVTVAVASLSYWLVERPALSLKRLVGPPRAGAPPREALAEPVEGAQAWNSRSA